MKIPKTSTKDKDQYSWHDWGIRDAKKRGETWVPNRGWTHAPARLEYHSGFRNTMYAIYINEKVNQ